ncbi:MAG: alpha amylase C-terminal domain-containing protein, partial [Kiritimatiellae bacterium]|nr:alpha amylase C-terminal domain-containing protein [Kiritimatiellia bacterium]
VRPGAGVGAHGAGMGANDPLAAAFKDDPLLPRLGAIPYGEGMAHAVRFRVWAPKAHSVGLQGDFNHWKPDEMHPDPQLPGVWTLDSRRAKAGDAYQYVIDGSIIRRDPQARAVRAHDNVSIVVDPRSWKWPASEAGWRTPDAKELVMYEMHLGTFTDGLVGDESRFRKAIKALPYLTGMGVNCIQLMPVNEFTGDRSWGYNPGDVFAIESSYGTPDDFRAFVAACHASGVAVTLDIVHNHWGPQELAVWRFDLPDGQGDPGRYFYADEERAFTEWGPRPDFSNPEVRRFILASVRMFVEEYHIDGFRWDSVFNIRYFPGNATEANPDGDETLRIANEWLEKRYPRVLRIAEDHAYDNGGVGFQAQWNSAFQARLSAFLAQPPARMDVGAFAVALKDLETGWVQFAECHDSAGDLNRHHRLPQHFDSMQPNGVKAKLLNLMANAVALTVPGIPMFLQGVEMHETADFSDGTPLPWGQARGPRKGLVMANRDLILLRRNAAGFTPGLKGDRLSVLQADNKNKVIVFMRYDSKGGLDAPPTVVVLNFSDQTLKDYSLRLPAKGIKNNSPVWYCLYNSSSPAYDKEFAGAGPRPGTGWRLSTRRAALPVELGPRSVVVLSMQGPADAKVIAAAAARTEPLGDWTVEASDDNEAAFDMPSADIEEFVEEIIAPFPYRFMPLP